MSIKNVYVIQPYHVGQKDRKSTAVIIPADIVKEFNINKNTILILRRDKNRTITIETITESEKIDQKDMISVDKSFQASGQQVSGEIY